MKHPSMPIIVMAMALSVAAPGILISPASAAQWLAPASQERPAADWVKDIAAQLRKEKWREVFMNAPFGAPQVAMLSLLNQAAIAMNEGETAYAKDLIRHAVGILNDGIEHGWYSRRDIEPLKGLILTRALEGLEETKKHTRGSKRPTAKEPDEEQAGYGPTERFDEPLFGSPDEYAIYGDDHGTRGTGYTENQRLGLTERRERRGGGEDLELDRSPGRSGQEDMNRWSLQRKPPKFDDYRETRERGRQEDLLDEDGDRLGLHGQDRMPNFQQNDEGRVGTMKPSTRGEQNTFSRNTLDQLTPDELEREPPTGRRTSRDDYEQYESRRDAREADETNERRWLDR